MISRFALALFLLLAPVGVLTTAIEPTRLATEGDLAWRKGNMHTHSHWSDGDDYLESIAHWYRQHDYQFLVFTDHNVLADSERWVTVADTKGGRQAYEKLKQNFPDWVEQREEGDNLQVRLRRFDEVAPRFNEPGKFLLVQGEEISDQALGKPVHLNASNLEHLIPPQGGRDVFETIDNNVRAVIAQREATGRPMIVHLNHPNFGYAITAEDLLRVRGEQFFEVYNGNADVANHGDPDHPHRHPGTERLWDIVLAQRLGVLRMPTMYGIATDDGHNYHNIPSRAHEPGRGWVEVLTSELTAKALIEALEAGHFYASSGVELQSIEYDDKHLAVEVAPEPGGTYTIDFIGTRNTTNLKGEPIAEEEGKPLATTHRYSNKIGQVLKSVTGTMAAYTFTGDELYVRAVVTSSAPHPNPSEIGDKKQAWVQPIRGPINSTPE